MSNYILALDQGTTSSRAILFDGAGRQHGMAQQEFRQNFPQPGWVEHDPEDIWQSQLAVMHEVLRSTGVTPAEIVAIGITNQRETTVLWDRRSGKPVAPAIVWQDRRTADMCERLVAEGHQELIRQRTGLVVDAYFSGTKLQWLLDYCPGLRERAVRGELAFGTVDAWLNFRLTGAHVTDISNASRTMLFNIHTCMWDQDLLDLMRIPPSLLPEVVPSSGIIGTTSVLGRAIPVAGIAGDQQAATFGQACHRPGMAKNTYGTGCFMLMHTGTTPVMSQHRLLTTIGWQTGARGDTGYAGNPGSTADTTYMLEGSVFAAGATVQWLRDELRIIDSSAASEALAASVPDSGDVLFVPAFAGLGAPYWDPYARGTILGITRGTTAAHITRAALDSIAYQSADLVTAMQADAGIALSELRVDGGASRNNLLMQFQADILDVPVIRPVITETTALGAACLAGLATGFWSSLEEIASFWRMERCFEPRMSSDEREHRLHRWHKAVGRARMWAE